VTFLERPLVVVSCSWMEVWRLNAATGQVTSPSSSCFAVIWHTGESLWRPLMLSRTNHKYGTLYEISLTHKGRRFVIDSPVEDINY